MEDNKKELDPMIIYVFSEGRIIPRLFKDIGLQEWPEGESMEEFFKSQGFDDFSSENNKFHTWKRENERMFISFINHSYHESEIYVTWSAFEYVSLLSHFGINLHKSFIINEIATYERLREIVKDHNNIIDELVPLGDEHYFVKWM